jgi:hypothetical protein
MDPFSFVCYLTRIRIPIVDPEPSVEIYTIIFSHQIPAFGVSESRTGSFLEMIDSDL